MVQHPIISGESENTPSRFMLRKPEMSSRAGWATRLKINNPLVDGYIYSQHPTA